MVDAKLLRRVRSMLIRSFRRKLLRRLLSDIVTAWHELALYHHVETRTKSELRDALKAQEALSTKAEETLDECASATLCDDTPRPLSPSRPLTLSPSRPLALSPSHPLTLPTSHPLQVGPLPLTRRRRPLRRHTTTAYWRHAAAVAARRRTRWRPSCDLASGALSTGQPCATIRADRWPVDRSRHRGRRWRGPTE